MKNILCRILAIFIWIAGLFSLAGHPRTALAADNTCNWMPGINSFYWEDGDNWACPSGKGPPSADNDVSISAGAGNAPIVMVNGQAKTVSLSGWLYIGGGASLTVSDGWSNSGNAAIDSQGTLYGNGEVKTGGTFRLLSSGTIQGNLTIDALSTASVDVVYLQGILTNHGSLAGEDQDAQFHMRGPLLSNYGSVAVDEFYFERGGGLIQEVTGSGGWGSGTDFLFVADNTRLTALSNLAFAAQHFVIQDDGSLLDVGTHMVTFSAPAAVMVSGAVMSSPGGSVHTQNTPVTLAVPNQGVFNPPLVLDSGVTHAYGIFNGPISIDQDATLRVMALPAGSLTAKSNVTVNGVLDGDDLDVSFNMQGDELNVNGQVTVASVYMQGVTSQKITGNGSLNIHNLSVEAPGGVNLGIPLNLDGWLGLNANLFADSGSTVTLAESAITNGENAATDIFGRIRRVGPFVKDKPYSFGNRSLTLTFTALGSGLPTQVQLDLSQQAWANLLGSIRRGFTFTSTGGSGWSANLSLDYRDSELTGHEEFLQTWTRSNSAQRWLQTSYSALNTTQNWIRLDGIGHFSDWGLALHNVFIPVLRK